MLRTRGRALYLVCIQRGGPELWDRWGCYPLPGGKLWKHEPARSLASFSLPLHHSSSDFSICSSVQGKVLRAERSQLRLAALLRGGRSVILWHAGESIEPLQHLINLELLGRIYKWSLLVMKLLIQSVQTRQKKKSKMWRLHVRSSDSHHRHFNDLSGALLSNISWEHGA